MIYVTGTDMTRLRPALKLSLEETTCLQPGRPLDGVVITAYLRLLERRSLLVPTAPTIWAFDTMFMTALKRDGYTVLTGRLEQVDIWAKDFLLFPTHLSYGAGHWCLIVIDIKGHRIRAYDSLGIDRRREMQLLFDFLHVHAGKSHKTIHTNQWALLNLPRSFPRQKDGVSCGVFLCMYAEAIATHIKPDDSEQNVLSMRKKIAQAVRREEIGDELKYANPSDDVVAQIMQEMTLGPIVEAIDLVDSSDEDVSEEIKNCIDELEVKSKESLLSKEIRSETPVLEINFEGNIGDDQWLQSPKSEVKAEITNVPARKASPTLTSADREKISAQLKRNRGKKRKNRFHRIRRLMPDGTYSRIKIPKRLN